jgi:hypothetical protein
MSVMTDCEPALQSLEKYESVCLSPPQNNLKPYHCKCGISLSNLCCANSFNWVKKFFPDMRFDSYEKEYEDFVFEAILNPSL